MGERLRRTGALLIISGLCAAVLVLIGCGGGSSSPTSATLSQHKPWNLTLDDVSHALAARDGGSWKADETTITLQFSQDELPALCGALSDPILSESTDIAASKISFSKNREASIKQSALPSQFSWADKDGFDWTSAVKFQGKYATCVAFASIAALETSLRIAQKQSKAALDFSEWDLWLNGPSFDEKKTLFGGWRISEAAEYLKAIGAIREECCPYSVGTKSSISQNQERTRITGWSAAVGMEAMKTALLKGPLVSTMQVRTDFFFYREGIYEPTIGNELGKHAILVIGYDDNQGCWICQNSWSSGWGENGRFRIKYGCIDETAITFNLDGIQKSAEVFLNIEPYISDLSTNSALICWTTNAEFKTQVEYGCDYKSLNKILETAPNTRHAVRLPNLTAGTEYLFKISAQTENGVLPLSSMQTFSTLPSIATIAAPIIYDVAIKNVSKDSAVVVWKTDRPATSRVYYSSSAYASKTEDLRLVTAHTINLRYLLPGMRHDLFVVSEIDSAIATSEPYLFTTVEAVPPVISELSAHTITKNSATVAWQTDELSTGQVEYGKTRAYGMTTPLNSVLSYGHQAILTGLSPATQYYFRVRSKDANGNEATLASPTPFVTLSDIAPPIEASAPVINEASATEITKNSAQIVWLTDVPSTSQVEYGITPAYGYVTPIKTELSYGHLVELSGLIPNRTYYYRVRSRDKSGREASATADIPYFTTLAESTSSADPTAPVISSQSAALVSGTSATVVWLTDEPATTQLEYGLTDAYGWSSPYDATLCETHKVVLAGLIASRTYYFRAKSKDKDGNESTATGSFSTLDTIPPILSNLFVTNVTGTSAVITFSTNEPCTGQVEYGLKDYNVSAPYSGPATTTFAVALDFLAPQATYKCRIRIYDQANNSIVTNPFTFTTLDIIAPVIYDISIGALTSSGAKLTWKTDKATKCKLKWGSAAGSYLDGEFSEVTPIFEHQAKLTWPIEAAAAEKHFIITAIDNSGNTTVSENQRIFLPPSIYDIVTSNVTASSAMITCKSNLPSSAELEYGQSSAYGARIPLVPSPAPYGTFHSAAIENLIPLCSYHYRIKIVDQLGREAVSEDKAFSTPTSGLPPMIFEIAAQNITPTSVQIVWKTDKNTSAAIEYGTISGEYTMQAVAAGQWSNVHMLSLSNLLPGRKYYYRVYSKDAEALQSVSPEYSFLTPGITSPIITAVQVTYLASDSAVIVWKTDQPCSSQVQYGFTNNYNLSSQLDSTLVTNHSVSLTQLSTLRTYHFRVRSRNAEGLETISSDLTFVTPDQAPPVIYDLVVQNITGNSAVVVWKTDEDSDSRLEYGTTAPPSNITGISSLLSKNHAVALSGLLSSTTYIINAISKDAYNNIASRSAVFSTLDRTAPVISFVNCTPLASNSVEITWLTDEAATSQVEYGTTSSYGSFMPQFPYPSTLSTTHSVILNNLKTAVLYHFRVRSEDAVGNLNISRDFAFKISDETSPVISDVAAVNITENSVTIIWNTDKAADSRVEYGATTAYGYVASVAVPLTASHSVTIGGLSPFTTYHFRVRSTDAAGNESISSDYTFVTRETLLVQNVTVNSYDRNSAIISWTTNVAAACYIRHGTSLPTDFSIPEDTSPWGTKHSVTIYYSGAPLTATTYYFQIKAFTGSNVTAYSEIRSFTTP